jgi:hypothetical protein
MLRSRTERVTGIEIQRSETNSGGKTKNRNRE